MTGLVLLPVSGWAWAVGIEFLTEELPWAVSDRIYSPQLDVRVSGACPVGGVGFTVVEGHLPSGIQLSRLGYFSGTPGHNGSFEFTVLAANGCSTVKKSFIIVVTGAPVVSVSPMHLDFKWKSGEVTPEQIVRVSATWPKLAYQIIVKDADWLKAVPERGITPREGSAMGDDPVHIRVDGSQLKPGHYSAIVTISAWQALSGSNVAVDLTVTGK
jgi:hypothetical protein